MARKRTVEPEVVRGPITGMPIVVPPGAPRRSRVRTVLGFLMAVVSTLLTLVALTSQTTRHLLSGTLAGFMGWLVGTLLLVGVPWVITAWLLAKPKAPVVAHRPNARFD